LRLFLDANVLFAAAYSPDGRSAALFALACEELCSLSSSRHAIDEAARNLAIKVPERMPALVRFLALVDVVPEADPRLVAWSADLGLPANDAPILAAAVASQVDLLVTGDRTHFGHLFGRSIGSVTVTVPRDALATVLDDGRNR